MWKLALTAQITHSGGWMPKGWSRDTNSARLKWHFLAVWQLALSPWPYYYTRSDRALQGSGRARSLQHAPGNWSSTILRLRRACCPVPGPLLSWTEPGSASRCNFAGLSPEGQRWLHFWEALHVVSRPSQGPSNTHLVSVRLNEVQPQTPRRRRSIPSWWTILSDSHGARKWVMSGVSYSWVPE